MFYLYVTDSKEMLNTDVCVSRKPLLSQLLSVIETFDACECYVMNEFDGVVYYSWKGLL